MLHGGIRMLAMGFSATVSWEVIPFFPPSPPQENHILTTATNVLLRI